MKLLLVTADYPPHGWSGIASAVGCAAEALVAQDVDVRVLTRFDVPTAPHQLIVRSASAPTFPWPGELFDCVHLHSLGFAELAFHIRRRSGARLVYTAHSLIDCELPATDQGRRAWSCQRAVMRAADAVVFLSEHERAAAIARIPTLAKSSHVVPNPLPPPPVSQPRTYDPSGPIVFAGRFAASKGIALLTMLVPRLLAACGGRFVAAGGHGDQESGVMMERLHAENGEAIVLPGWLSTSALEALFAAAAVVLVPSAYEPFGMVALEAMRMGAPVLASSVGGLAENVTPASGGRLIASRDPDVWCQATLELLADLPAATALANRGPAYVARRFDAHRHACQLLDDVYCRRGQAPIALQRSSGAPAHA